MSHGQQAPTAPADQILAALAGPSQTPGLQYLVVDADGVVLDRAFGSADLRRQTPMTGATTMMAYSMSKTITAAAVLQLVQQGRVQLDDAVEPYVPSMPYGSRVSVRQLITHTSGIPNPIPLRWVHRAEAHERFDEDAALAEILRKHPRLAFEPGTRYTYSNIGYWLLGKVVERASGETFSTYVTEHILRKLPIDPEELGYVVADPANHAIGYLEKYSIINVVKGLLIDRQLIGNYCGRWLEIRGHYLNGPAFGGLVGSARAFAVFLQDQLRPRSALFDDATRALFYTQQHTTSGRIVPMTLGWHVGTLKGSTFFYKEGGGGGFHCMMRLYPEHGVGTIVMSNATGFDVANLLNSADTASFVR